MGRILVAADVRPLVGGDVHEHGLRVVLAGVETVLVSIRQDVVDVLEADDEFVVLLHLTQDVTTDFEPSLTARVHRELRHLELVSLGIVEAELDVSVEHASLARLKHVVVVDDDAAGVHALVERNARGDEHHALDRDGDVVEGVRVDGRVSDVLVATRHEPGRVRLLPAQRQLRNRITVSADRIEVRTLRADRTGRFAHVLDVAERPVRAIRVREALDAAIAVHAERSLVTEAFFVSEGSVLLHHALEETFRSRDSAGRELELDAALVAHVIGLLHGHGLAAARGSVGREEGEEEGEAESGQETTGRHDVTPFQGSGSTLRMETPT